MKPIIEAAREQVKKNRFLTYFNQRANDLDTKINNAMNILETKRIINNEKPYNVQNKK